GRTMHPRYLFETSGKTFAFYRDTDGTYVVTVKGAPVVSSEMPSEVWHRWSVRWNGTKVDLFRDGTLRASAELGEPFSLIEAPYLFIGCDSDGDNQFNALIDDLALSRVALSDQDIRTRYTSGEPTPKAGYSSIYRFDGSLLADGTTTVAVSGTSSTSPIRTHWCPDATPGANVTNR